MLRPRVMRWQWPRVSSRAGRAHVRFAAAGKAAALDVRHAMRPSKSGPLQRPYGRVAEADLCCCPLGARLGRNSAGRFGFVSSWRLLRGPDRNPSGGPARAEGERAVWVRLVRGALRRARQRTPLATRGGGKRAGSLVSFRQAHLRRSSRNPSGDPAAVETAGAVWVRFVVTLFAGSPNDLPAKAAGDSLCTCERAYVLPG